MDATRFDEIAREELAYIEDQLEEVDPDEVECTSSDGVLTLELRDGVKVIINSHRAARQIWMAAVASAWHFDLDESDGRWRTAKGEELRGTLVGLIAERIGLSLDL